MPDLLPFLVVAVVVVVVPGVDMALVTRNTVRGDRRSGLITTLGILCGVCVHAIAAMLGLSAIVATSASAFQAVKIAGAVYLIALGIRSLLAAKSPRSTTSPAEPPRRGNPFLEGFVTNVLNPKLAVFFLSLMPQFVVESAATLPQLAVLSLVFLVSGAAWLTFYVTAIDRIRPVMERPAIGRVIDAVFGFVLVGLGAQLAAVDNS